MTRPDVTESFAQLKIHRKRIDDYSILDLFHSDPERFQKFHLRLDDLLFDFSKHKLDESTFSSLLGLVSAAKLDENRSAFFSGAKVNTTEKRPALHMALRNLTDEPIFADGVDVMPDVRTERARVDAFSSAIRDGQLRGSTGLPFKSIINIGIGGSDLGPAMAVRALTPFGRPDLRMYFVSNVDGADLGDTLKGVDLATTLFIISSKTFSTQETMANARAARAFVVDALGEKAIADHFCAVSTKLDLVAQFGIQRERTFGFWNWIGGRYSIWSAIGLAINIAIGPDNFRAFLSGAQDVDRHFQTAPLEKNIPVVMAALDIWSRNICGCQSRAVIPYDQRLARFPAYLQQLEMESNGKSVTQSGDPVGAETSAVIWGEPGTNGQHAFFQMLHQGTDIIPVDFLIAAEPMDADPAQHELLFANCMAQSDALMRGRSIQEARSTLERAGLPPSEVQRLAPHKTFPGSRPSSTFIYRALTPHTLGRLIALFEHKVFVQSVVWNINPFDQWGVELGKELCGDLAPIVADTTKSLAGLNESTAGLIDFRRQLISSAD